MTHVMSFVDWDFIPTQLDRTRTAHQASQSHVMQGSGRLGQPAPDWLLVIVTGSHRTHICQVGGCQAFGGARSE